MYVVMNYLFYGTYVLWGVWKVKNRLEIHNLIRGFFIHGVVYPETKNLTNYVFCYLKFSGVIHIIENDYLCHFDSFYCTKLINLNIQKNTLMAKFLFD